ncbi:MAG: site-specific integrase [Muribaculaceae bacterium]|nr:site-specific integrase [Muribaculaceae bacterium]
MKSKNTEALELAKYISGFISEYAPSHLTNSGNTVRSYESALTLYIYYLETQCRVTPDKFKAACFDQEHIEGWMKWLSGERKCSATTCNNRLSAMRAFTRYLSSRDIKYLPLNTGAVAVPYRKAARKKISGIPREAVKAILAEPDVHSRAGLRDVTLMVTLYATAARINELLSLRVCDIHLDAQKPYAVITGKGGKIRTLYLLPKAVGFLEAYMKKYHGDTPGQGDLLFFSPIYGKDSKLSQQAVLKLLRKYAEAAHEKCDDVPLNLHAHQFRHAKATHWLEDGMNIVQISFLLGHSSVETTMAYLDITTEQELKALETIEDEKNKNVSPKWDSQKDTLFNLCGLRKPKQ